MAVISPRDTAFFIPAKLSKFKMDLFNRVGSHIAAKGGMVIRGGDAKALARLPDDITPIVGAMPEIKHLFDEWKARDRNFVYWDRGYFRRVFATWLPRGENGGYYRYHLNGFQARQIRDVPSDRWNALISGNRTDARRLEMLPWRQGGRNIVIAEPPPGYAALHGVEDWTEKTIARLKVFSDRPIVRRRKDELDRPLISDLVDAHCLVTHGSITAVEAVILGCPVFVDGSSAAALAGKTDLSEIETPIYPDRQAWANSLSYDQFDERELVNGVLWKLIT